MRRIAICDDNEIERQIIAEMLKEYCRGIQQQVELKKRIEVKCGKQYRYPFTSDIMYIEGVAHKATFFLVDGSTISTIEKISTLKERIGGESFLQCHQNYLVNMAYIADIQKEVHMTNGKKIPISVHRRTETIELYHQFF